MTQREKSSVDKEWFEAATGKSVEFLSGGQIENFKEGWAQNVIGGEKVHYFKRSRFNIGYAIPVCGTSTSAVRWLYGEGNFPRCKNCSKIMDKVKRRK